MESLTRGFVLPWYAIGVIILVIIFLALIWYYMYCNSPDPSCSSDQMIQSYSTVGPKSYDFFNTLVTRRDASVPQYEVYRGKERYHITDEMFEHDRRNLIPINANLRLVRPGDYIVSDTCYTSEQISKMLQDHLDFPVSELHVIATEHGKAHKTVWSRLPRNIVFHLGDNFQTDYLSPRSHRFLSYHYTYDSDRYNRVEELFKKNGLHKSAQILREMRLSNPRSRFVDTDYVVSMWELQAEYNISVLVFFILYLDEWLKQRPHIRRIYGVLRDCWYLVPLMQKFLKADVEIDYMYSSRKSLTETSVSQRHQSTIDYFIDHTGDDVVWVDLSGTGNSSHEFCSEFRVDPWQLNVIRVEHPNSRDFSPKCAEMFKSTQHQWKIESINSAPFGSFVKWEDQKAVHGEFEYPIDLIEAGSDAITYYTERGHIGRLVESLREEDVNFEIVLPILQMVNDDPRVNEIIQRWF